MCIPRDVHPHLFLPKTPLLFKIIGQITVEECFLTARGHLRPPDKEPIASCWLQQRPNITSDITWRGIIPTLEAIIEQYGGEVDPSELLALGPDGKLRLQMTWQGDVGETGRDLPIFDELGIQRVPASISDVPFGEAVHAVFSIEFVHDRTAGARTVFASLFAMHKA
ncbi:hypothetical protein GSI_06616 [Ganoderma sinense ZZ0214-1]|uniref:Uncharacterized protein n=1 Tax=Ganoderma sinense ZZ0214-1 TaxID=1077348 RepID=A0A2G8SDS7_9APHY|nr:hypothetical protein GSI_06616 [Ganoderma sinense ZZ0214-1]